MIFEAGVDANGKTLQPYPIRNRQACCPLSLYMCNAGLWGCG